MKKDFATLYQNINCMNSGVTLHRAEAYSSVGCALNKCLQKGHLHCDYSDRLSGSKSLEKKALF